MKNRKYGLTGMKKRIMAISAAVLMAAVVIAGCSANYESAASDSKAYYDEGSATSGALDYTSSVAPEYASEMAEAPAVDAAEGVTVTGANVAEGRKLIKTMDFTVETLDLEAFMNDLRAKVDAAGGYIENMNEGKTSYYNDTPWAYFTIRIPETKLIEFASYIENYSNVTAHSENTQDITLSYSDTENLKEMYETEQKKLMEMLEKAENMEDMIAIETRLAEVRYQLESVASQLRIYDNQVDYSTIYVNVTEVEHLTQPDSEAAETKMSEGLKKSWDNLIKGLKNFGIGFVVYLPYIIFIVIIAVAIIIIIRVLTGEKRKAKKAAKKADKEAKKATKKAEKIEEISKAGAETEPQSETTE